MLEPVAGPAADGSPRTLLLLTVAVICLRRALLWGERADYVMQVLTCEPDLVVQILVERHRHVPGQPVFLTLPDRNVVAIEVVLRDGRSVELTGTPFENRDLLVLLTARCPVATLVDRLGPQSRTEPT